MSRSGGPCAGAFFQVLVRDIVVVNCGLDRRLQHGDYVGHRLRADWIGVTVSGLVVAGIALFWREVLGLIGSLFRKYADEAAELERQHGLRRIA